MRGNMSLKWSWNRLIRDGVSEVFFDENVVLPLDAFAGFNLIQGTEDVHVKGVGYMDVEAECFYVNMHVTGLMLCMDAISGEEVRVPFAADADETYSFTDTSDEDVRIVKDDVIDLTEAVRDAIILEAPLQVTDVDPADYPSGDGWRVMSEDEYERSGTRKIDPRLAKLQEFKR